MWPLMGLFYMEAPNPKFQIPDKYQITSSKEPVWNLRFGNWNLLGVWCMRFGTLTKCLSFGIILFAACSSKQSGEPVEYNGPLREAIDVDMLYAEKDRIKVKMKASRILEFKNGDREFPEGVYLEFFDVNGKLTSTLKANQAYYFKKEDLWRGRGKVEVKNLEKNQQLFTEELFWNPLKKKINTEKFVTIKLESEVIYGTGLDALQDLSSYTILKPKGDFEVND